MCDLHNTVVFKLIHFQFQISRVGDIGRFFRVIPLMPVFVSFAATTILKRFAIFLLII